MRQASIFVVEDETLIRMMLVQIIEELGHRVIAEASNVEDGRSLAEIEEYISRSSTSIYRASTCGRLPRQLSGGGYPFFPDWLRLERRAGWIQGITCP
jgi:CheY-like chemotaxis protein